MIKRPCILVSNDDGFVAPGILFLLDVLKPIGDVVMVAPNSGRSGMSTAITVKTPLDMTLVSQEPGLTMYRSNGTPADCIKLALNILFADNPPALVVSGVNHGSNASVAIHYSGTMGAVLEACMSNIPGIGFSLDSHQIQADFEPSRAFITKIVKETLRHGLPSGICLNVNIPNVPEIKGIKLCRQTKGKWVEEFDVRKHPRGGDYYWLMGSFRNDELTAEDTDIYALDHGFISIVPSQIDLSSKEQIQAMRSWDL